MDAWQVATLPFGQIPYSTFKRKGWSDLARIYVRHRVAGIAAQE